MKAEVKKSAFPRHIDRHQIQHNETDIMQLTSHRHCTKSTEEKTDNEQQFSIDGI